jgi:hypothetical protein
MNPDVVAALIAAIGGIIVAIIVAYATAKATSRKEFNELRRTVIVNQLKVDTLWEIYAEDAIRTAKTAHLIAAQSAVRPTGKFREIISPELCETIYTDALIMSDYIVSPYDIAVEIWNKHKKELVERSNETNISIRAIWGAVVVLCENAVNDKESEDE